MSYNTTTASFFESSAVDSTQQWCEVCSQSTARGCNVFSTSNVIWDVADPVSPLAAGFIGAGAAIALWALGFGVLAFMGYLKFVRPSRARRARQQASAETGSSVRFLRFDGPGAGAHEVLSFVTDPLDHEGKRLSAPPGMRLL